MPQATTVLQITRLSRRARAWLLPCAVGFPTPSWAASPASAPDLGAALPLWSVLPFVGILLSIALFPLLAPRFWHHHYPKISLAWALALAGPFLLAYRQAAVHEILHIVTADYVPFIVLLWGLFTVAGGIVLRGRLAGTPGVNTLFLLVGTLAASWVGTTGAAMLFIRPLLRANAHRKRKVHLVVFFIVLVANVGGSLTPLGDPPLLLGFLHGVPFFWTLRLFAPMALLTGCLLVVFYAFDSLHHRREAAAARGASGTSLRVEGLYNLVPLAGIVLAVLFSGAWHAAPLHFAGVEWHPQNILRNALIVAMGALSLWWTPRELRRANDFSWEPMREVAILFAGIFITMIPALAILRAGEHGHLAWLIGSVREPWQYFWATGLLSSFLDNAPTYLTFFNSQLGRFYPGVPEPQAVARLIHEHALYLEAVAAGSVFMGANTYIGNAPNFMVKAIAEEAGVAMPSFFGYLFKWTVPLLLPLYAVVSLVFF